jgi:hypothetical protein
VGMAPVLVVKAMWILDVVVVKGCRMAESVGISLLCFYPWRCSSSSSSYRLQFIFWIFWGSTHLHHLRGLSQIKR